MDLRQLRYFLAIVEHGSFSRASESLFVAQSALSTQIKNLEDELGCRLLVRSPQGVDVTPNGERLVQHAGKILAQVNIAIQDLRRAPSSDVRATVRIGLTSTYSRVLMVPLLDMVEKHMPNLSLHVMEALTVDLDRMIQSGEVDLAVVFRSLAPKGNEMQRVLREERLFLVSPPSTSISKMAFEKRSVSIAELGAMDLILPSPRLTLRNLIADEAKLREVPLRIKYEVDSLPQTLALIERTGCHSVMLLSSFYREWLQGNLWAREISPLNLRPLTALKWLPKNHDDAISALAELVERTVDQLKNDGRWPMSLATQ